MFKCYNFLKSLAKPSLQGSGLKVLLLRTWQQKQGSIERETVLAKIFQSLQKLKHGVVSCSHSI